MQKLFVRQTHNRVLFQHNCFKQWCNCTLANVLINALCSQNFY